MSPATLLALNGVLALMMFGIALSLRMQDFVQVFKSPKGPITGLFAQFVLLPLLTFLATLALPLPPEIELGLLLVSACPGGSFSNIVTHLAKGNTAMSVSMTAIASIGATLMTPLNFVFYSGLNPETASLLKTIEVPASQIFVTVAGVLGIPLAIGLWVNQRFPKFSGKSEAFFRYFSLFALFAFVIGALAGNWAQFKAQANFYMLAVVVHNAMALGIGYLSAKLAGLGDADRRAITLEVGLQNSGLGLGIIFTFFSDLPGMAIIAAGWGVWHLVSGMSLVWYWSGKTPSATPGSRRISTQEASQNA